jgi:hypothetical protein
MSADAGHTTSYGYTAHLRDVPFDEARARITEALIITGGDQATPEQTGRIERDLPYGTSST